MIQNEFQKRKKKRALIKSEGFWRLFTFKGGYGGLLSTLS
jgi:hypothetical protein